MLLDTNYEGWAHIREGSSYCMNDEWNNNYIYCRYISYDKQKKTLTIYSDYNKNPNKFKTFFRDVMNYDDNDYIFVSGLNLNSCSLIKIISLEECSCNINELNILKMRELKNNKDKKPFNVDDLEA